jgi:hypothetical protein
VSSGSPRSAAIVRWLRPWALPTKARHDLDRVGASQ